MGSTTARRGQVGDFPTIAERYSVPEGSLAEVKAMFCDRQCVKPRGSLSLFLLVSLSLIFSLIVGSVSTLPI